jgi:hypothetical protein
MITTNINITKPFWALCHHSSSTGGFTGRIFSEYFLIECDSAKELDENLADGSVDAGESMREYSFHVVALYTDWELHHQNVAYQEEFESNQEVTPQ